jgi:molecular chaperone GrpE
MIGEDDRSTERSAAGPVTDDEGALRAGSSSTPSSSAPPADERLEGGPSESGAQGAEGDSSPEQVEKDLDALLADTQRERDEYLDLARRTKADFENYRKRMAAETQAAAARGKAELAIGLIGVIDNLERALVAAGIDAGEEQPPEEPLAQGILLTYRELGAVLERSGVEAYAPKGEKFDPQWHEALSTQPVEGSESGLVVEVLQKGYRFGDQVIRPARVVVSE